MENKLKHLEMLQNVITRMSANLFMLKGWSVTLVGALFALATKDINQGYILIAFCLVLIFWTLDGFFLHQERMYRSLYDEVRLKQEQDIDFSMDTRKFNTDRNTWWSSFFSKTLVIFYLSLLFITIIIYFFLTPLSNSDTELKSTYCQRDKNQTFRSFKPVRHHYYNFE